MPSSYVDIDRDEMEYVDGGLIGLPESVEIWIWGVIGGIVGNIIYNGALPGWMVKAAVKATNWVKWAFEAAKIVIKANPFAAGAIVGGSIVAIGC